MSTRHLLEEQPATRATKPRVNFGTVEDIGDGGYRMTGVWRLRSALNPEQRILSRHFVAGRASWRRDSPKTSCRPVRFAVYGPSTPEPLAIANG